MKKSIRNAFILTAMLIPALPTAHAAEPETLCDGVQAIQNEDGSWTVLAEGEAHERSQGTSREELVQEFCEKP
jgi:hypothetical protein